MLCFSHTTYAHIHSHKCIMYICVCVCVRMTCETCIAVTFSRSFRRVVATGSSSVKERAGRQKSELSASLSCSQTSSHICIGVCVCVCMRAQMYVHLCMHACMCVHTTVWTHIVCGFYLFMCLPVHFIWSALNVVAFLGVRAFLFDHDAVDFFFAV